jgi:hypothetical protein
MCTLVLLLLLLAKRTYHHQNSLGSRLKDYVVVVRLDIRVKQRKCIEETNDNIKEAQDLFENDPNKKLIQ